MGCERILPAHLETAMTKPGSKAPDTTHNSPVCLQMLEKQAKINASHLVLSLLLKEKKPQNLITDVSCNTDTSPADPVGIAVPRPFPHKHP